MKHYRYIIIGAGIAGVTAVRAIRERDREGALLLLGDEDRLPYKRTKISKNIAAGFERDRFAMEQEDWYRDNHVDLLYDDAVTRIDPDDHRVELRSGERARWDRLILATGATPVIPFETAESMEGAHVVRTANQVEALRRDMDGADRVIVVGAGVLGVEVSEQLRLLGKEVLLVGRSERLIGRHLDEEAATRLAALFREQGIEVLTGSPAALVAPPGRGSSARFEISVPEGRRSADSIVFCVGVKPNVELAAAGGIRVGRGIVVDERLETSSPDVFAAGDVAEHPGGYLSFLWHAAEHQGYIAGVNAAGERLVDDGLPFRLKCEVFGHYFFSMSPPQDEAGCEARRERQGDAYRVLYYRDGRLRGVVMVDDKERAKIYVTAVREGWSAEQVADRLSFAHVG